MPGPTAPRGKVAGRVAVSKRLRYEVLRRDNYACRYCGAFAPLAVLVVDHVTPRKHGGPDVASNLITACEDCNAGKSATMPERWLVAEVKKIARDSVSGRRPVPPEDDLSDMYAYQDALYYLETLPAEQVLRCIAHVLGDVYPYRPDGSELIRAAAVLAREGYGAPSAEVLT